MPGTDVLPDGPRRTLTAEIHRIYTSAGRPSTRQVALAIRDDHNYRDSVSHETVSAILRGVGHPGWSKIECVTRQLCKWSIGERYVTEELRIVHAAWLLAEGERLRPDTSSGKREVLDRAGVSHPQLQIRMWRKRPGLALLEVTCSSIVTLFDVRAHLDGQGWRLLDGSLSIESLDPGQSVRVLVRSPVPLDSSTGLTVTVTAADFDGTMIEHRITGQGLLHEDEFVLEVDE